MTWFLFIIICLSDDQAVYVGQAIRLHSPSEQTCRWILPKLIRPGMTRDQVQGILGYANVVEGHGPLGESIISCEWWRYQTTVCFNEKGLVIP